MSAREAVAAAIRGLLGKPEWATDEQFDAMVVGITDAAIAAYEAALGIGEGRANVVVPRSTVAHRYLGNRVDEAYAEFKKSLDDFLAASAVEDKP